MARTALVASKASRIGERKREDDTEREDGRARCSFAGLLVGGFGGFGNK